MAKRITLAHFGAELQIVKSNLNKARGAVTMERVERIKGDGYQQEFANGAHQRIDRIERGLADEHAARVDGNKVVENKVVGLIHDFAKQFSKNDKAALDEYRQLRHDYDAHIAQTTKKFATLYIRLRWLLTGK